MNVHIVWPTPDGDKILDRLARLLVAGADWTVSDRPDPRADINYSIVYIDFAQRFSDWRKTPWAAYFSHYEPHVPYKKYWWESSAPLIDIKTVTADQYGEILPGKIVKVTPPVDRDFFNIRERKANKKPIIGVSGFVVPGGRKGEQMVARLAADFEGKAEIVASGQGWPARKVNNTFEGLPAFYNSLDFYLCTSTIEGIPMPPLEALACGIPVIIPRGVGMLDDLPEAEGISRFEPGNYDSLKTVVESELESAYKSEHRETLRSLTEGYTPEAWVESHVKGFEGALHYKGTSRKHNLAKSSSAVDQHGMRGVYYVAYGAPARECAKGAIDSFKRHLPDIPVALVSDEPLGPEDIFVQHEDYDIGGRAAKVKIYDLAPKEWTYICYLDADTEIVEPVDFIWKVVEDGWDMVICKNPSRFHVASQMNRSDNKDECDHTFGLIGTDQVIQLNGGVFAFQRNQRTQAFFKRWYEEWQKWGKRDQAALLRALWAHPLKLYVLGNEFNTITRYDSPDIAAWLKHYPMTARRWRGVVHHRLDDPGAWQAVKEFEAQ